MGKFAFLYDVLNKIILANHLSAYRTSEASLFKTLSPHIAPGDLILLDRYYGTVPIISELVNHEADFIIRMKYHWKEVKTFFRRSKQKDILIEKELIDACGEAYTKTLRLVKHKLKDGSIHVYLTSLLDSENYSRKAIIDLYYTR